MRVFPFPHKELYNINIQHQQRKTWTTKCSIDRLITELLIDWLINQPIDSSAFEVECSRWHRNEINLISMMVLRVEGRYIIDRLRWGTGLWIRTVAWRKFFQNRLTCFVLLTSSSYVFRRCPPPLPPVGSSNFSNLKMMDLTLGPLRGVFFCYILRVKSNLISKRGGNYSASCPALW